MDARKEKIVDLFSAIREVIQVEDIKFIKKITYYGFTNIINEDDYIKSLVIQLLCVSYVRYFELQGHVSDSLDITKDDIEENKDKEVLMSVNPINILNIALKIESEVKESVKNKIAFILQRFAAVPCFSIFYWNHEEFITDEIRNVIAKKENLETGLEMNKAYSKLFYLNMFEIYNHHSYPSGATLPPSYVESKTIEILDEILQKMENILKGKEALKPAEAASFALNSWMNHYTSKEIAKKTYYIVEQIFKYICTVTSKNSFALDTGFILEIDIDFIVVIKWAAKNINKDDAKVNREMDASFTKLVRYLNEIENKSQADTVSSKPKSTNISSNAKSNNTKKLQTPTNNKKKKLKNKVSSPKKWGFLAFVSLVEAFLFAYLWKLFQDATIDTSIRDQILYYYNVVVGKIDQSLIVTAIENDILLKISDLFSYAAYASIVIFILYCLLSKKIDTNKTLGKVVLFIISLLYGIAKLPISTLIASICICRSKKYLFIDSKFIKFIISVIPIAVFVLSCIFI